ncbi:phospholipase C domain protein [Collimonas arenae]|nr:phospholipase C domain protein [Collimonas arenae]
MNYVDHTLTDQTSILRFIEDNWLSGQRIAGSYDAIAGTLNNMLNLGGTPSTSKLILDPTTGQATTGTTSKNAVIAAASKPCNGVPPRCCLR